MFNLLNKYFKGVLFLGLPIFFSNIICNKNNLDFKSNKKVFNFGYTYKNLNQKKISKNLSIFLKNIRDYKLNAPWVMQELAGLNLDEFCFAWPYIIDLLTDSKLQPIYLDCSRDKYNQKDYKGQLLWQCICYDTLLSKLYLNIKSNKLIYITYSKNNINKNEFIPILDYFILNYDITKDHKFLYTAQFYAFFFDCLSDFFCNTINNTFKLINLEHKKHQEKLYINRGIKTLKYQINIFEYIIKRLKYSKFYNKYSLSIKRYRELIDILDIERISYLNIKI